jgi:hypothetical protein
MVLDKVFHAENVDAMGSAILLLHAVAVGVAYGDSPSLHVAPARVLLDTPEASQQLLVTSIEDAMHVDATRCRLAAFRPSNLGSVASGGGWLRRRR